MIKEAQQVRETLKKCMSKFLTANPKVQVELSATLQKSIFFRLARSEVIQPQNELSTRITVRVIDDKKTGIASSNSILEEDISSTLNIAHSIARAQKPREEAGLPEKAFKQSSHIEGESSLFNLRKNFERLSDWLLFAKEARVALSGKFQVTEQAIVVVNSVGTECEFSFPLVRVEFIAERGEMSGFGSYISHNLEPYLVQIELERAVSKVSHYGEMIELGPGEYEVVLEPEAASEFVELFAIYSFGAKLYQENRSYVSGRMDKKEFAETVTLYDSSREEAQIRMPFDFEGVHKKKVSLVENGTIKNVVYDTETARKEGRKSTGHALPLPNPHGPAPMHLCFKPGTKTLEDIVSGVDKGLLVTRLNYTNIEDLKNGVITGMTRDGTFLIEKGEIVGPVYDLRFTQSVPEALKNVVEVGNQTKLVSPLFGFSLFPPLKIECFKITGIKKKK